MGGERNQGVDVQKSMSAEELTAKLEAEYGNLKKRGHSKKYPGNHRTQVKQNGSQQLKDWVTLATRKNDGRWRDSD